MHPDVHRYLDGELPRDALDAAALAELRAWERATSGTERLREERAPADLMDRVMAAVGREAVAAPASPAAAPRRGMPRRAWHWLAEPRPVRVRPALLLAAAAAIVVLLLRPYGGGTAPATPDAIHPVAAAQGDGAAPVYVQFVFNDASARSVSVAGDFNGWDAAGAPLRDPDGDGVWTAMFPLRPGVHKYMFVVDGHEWVTDPHAEAHVEDGFGMRNALITVAAVPERSS